MSSNGIALHAGGATVSKSEASRSADLRILLRAEWDRTLAYGLIGIGAVLVIATFIGVSGTAFVADQLAYIASGGIGGLFLLACGLTLMVSADHHDEWRKLDGIERALLHNGDAVVARSRLAEGRVRGLAVMGAGAAVAAVIIGVGWVRSSGTGENGTAAQGLTLSLGGLLLMVAASAAFLAPSRTRLMSRRAHLLRGFLLTDALAGLEPLVPAGRTEPAAPTTVVVAAGLTRYHLADCRAVDGLTTTAVDRQDLDPALQGCELCGSGSNH